MPRLLPSLLAASLAALTLLTFYPVVTCNFINLDDSLYITAPNAPTQMGLSPSSILHAFTHRVADLYHPLTLLSLMLDYQLFGLSPAAFHAVNLCLHTINVILLFLLLRSLTASTYRSALLAALFAIHPLRVESVAWTVERKDTLMLLFGLLTFLAYLRYARQPSWPQYLIVIACYLLSLLAKPMLVTLPALLLLLDHWPLHRPLNWRNKLPLLFIGILFALAAPSWSPRDPDALQTELDSPLPRLLNALVSYPRYLYKHIDCRDLVAWYPYVPWKNWQILASAALLLALTAAALALRKNRPAFFVGWLWFLIALLPVVGLTRLAGYSLADRYTYPASIGLLLAAYPLLPSTWPRSRLLQTLSITAFTSILLALSLATRAQIPVWTNSLTLWTHATQHSTDNWMAHIYLGHAYAAEKLWQPALDHYTIAHQIAPHYAKIHLNSGYARRQLGDLPGALADYQTALQTTPNSWQAHFRLGCLLLELHDPAQALLHHRQAVQLAPDNTLAINYLAYDLAQAGRLDQAIQLYKLVLEINPADPDARRALDTLQTARPPAILPH